MRQYKHARKDAKFINISAGSEVRSPTFVMDHGDCKAKISKRKSKLKLKPISHVKPLKEDSWQNQNKRYTSNTHCYNVDHPMHQHLDAEINGMSDVSREGNYDESNIRGQSARAFLVRQESDDRAHFTTMENFHKSASNNLEHSYSVTMIDENEASRKKFLFEDHERYYLMNNGNQRMSTSVYEQEDALHVFSDDFSAKHRHRKRKPLNSVRHNELSSVIPMQNTNGKTSSYVDGMKQVTTYLGNGVWSPSRENANRELSRRYQWKKQARNSSSPRYSSKKKDRIKVSSRKKHRRNFKKVAVGGVVSKNRKLDDDLVFKVREKKRNKPHTPENSFMYRDSVDESRYNRRIRTPRRKQGKRGKKRNDNLGTKKKTHSSRIYDKIKTTQHFQQPVLSSRRESRTKLPLRKRTSKNNNGQKPYKRSAKQARRVRKQQMVKDLGIDFNKKGALFSHVVSQNRTQDYESDVSSDELNRKSKHQVHGYTANERRREELRHRSKHKLKGEKKCKKSRTTDRKKRHSGRAGWSTTKNMRVRNYANGNDRRRISPKNITSRCDMVKIKPKWKGAHSRQISAPVLKNTNPSFSINWKLKNNDIEPRRRDQDYGPKTDNIKRPKNNVSEWLDDSFTRSSSVDSQRETANYVEDVSKYHLRNIHQLSTKLGSSSVESNSVGDRFHDKSYVDSTITDLSDEKVASSAQEGENWDKQISLTSSRTDRKCEQESSKWSFLVSGDESEDNETNSKIESRSLSILSSLSANIAYKWAIADDSFGPSSATDIDDTMNPTDDRKCWLVDDDLWQNEYNLRRKMFLDFESNCRESSWDGHEQDLSVIKQPSKAELSSKRSSLRSRTQVIDSARQYPMQVGSKSPRKDAFSSKFEKWPKRYNGAVQAGKEILILEGRKL